MSIKELQQHRAQPKIQTRKGKIWITPHRLVQHLQNPWKFIKEKKRQYRFYSKKWICNTHYVICNTCYTYAFSEIEKDMTSYSDTRLEWLKPLCNTNVPGKTQPYCACQKRGFVGHQTGIKKTRKIKKEKETYYIYIIEKWLQNLSLIS